MMYRVKQIQTRLQILSCHSRHKRRIYVHVNCGDGTLTSALKRSDSYIIHGLDKNPDNVTKAREYLLSKGNMEKYP
jgi:trans-aconitate methyltransferase